MKSVMHKIILFMIFSFLLFGVEVYSQVKFAVIGDYGKGSDSDCERVAGMVNGWANVDFILGLGENTYYDNLTYDDGVGKFYHQWMHPYNGSYGSDTASINRFFPTVGNHDYYVGTYGFGIDSGYTKYFQNILAPFSSSSGNIRYYKVRWSDDVELFILNNYNGWQNDTEDGGTSGEPDGVDSNSVQAQWLKAQLAASTAHWKIVAVHGPPYTNSAGCNSNEFNFWLSRWNYKAWGADAVLSAHYGTYQRMVVDGLLYIVNGVGGMSHGCFSNIPDSLVTGTLFKRNFILRSYAG